ncbi:hypothetical protein [Dietzia maris]|uniref:hypothetical protein n=1 Tax=Dietzia maris TaxID=37915 RepID=UPI0037C9D493
MKRSLFPAVAFTIYALTLAGCSNDDDGGFEPAATPAETSTEQVQETNERGAVEVDLGEPVTLTDDTGTPLITITNSRLDATGCNAVSYDDIPAFAAEGVTGEIRQVKFVADVEVGAQEYAQWLWSSDFYFTNDDSEVVQNIQVAGYHDDLLGTSCEGDTSIIDLPPNSKAKGATSLDIPIGSENGGPTIIGYEVNGNRVEWRLPEGWADELGEPVFFQ